MPAEATPIPSALIEHLPPRRYHHHDPTYRGQIGHIKAGIGGHGRAVGRGLLQDLEGVEHMIDLTGVRGAKIHLAVSRVSRSERRRERKT